MRTHSRRQRPGRCVPISVWTYVLCAALFLLSAPARAQITYAHVLYDDKVQGFWKNGSWRAEIDAAHKTRVYNGTCSMEVTLKGKGALCFWYDKGWGLTRFTALVGWIHGGSEGGQNLRVLLTDTEGNVLPSKAGLPLATDAHIQGGTITGRQWQFFIIPVSELKPGYKDTTRIIFYNPSEETMPTFYLDDVGFTTERVQLFSQPRTVEEQPVTRPTRVTQALYTDGLENGWENWSWNSSLELDNKDNPAQGKQAILVEQEPGGGLAFGRQDAFPTGGYTAFEFYVNGGRTGGQKLSVSIFDEHDQIIGTVSVNDVTHIQGGAITGGRWQQVYIPLADLRATAVRARKIAIINDDTEKTLYYVDAVSLVK
jgi:hypothetical protein